MKGILKSNKEYFGLFFILIFLLFLSACGGVTPTGPNISSFTATSISITQGESVALSWVTDATSLSIDQAIGTVTAPSGSTTVTPAETITYTLTACNSIGTSTAIVTITVNPVVVPEQTITIQPGPTAGKDSYINSEALPGFNAGSSNELSVGNPFAATPTFNVERFNLIPIEVDTLRSFLQFDLGLLPANAVITNASFKLYQYYTLGSEDITIGVHQVNESWEEDTINWGNKPTYLSVPEDITSVVAGEMTWLSWDITDLLQGWLDESIANYGLMLKSTEELSDNSSISCYSSDYMDDSALHPKLEITYSVP